MLCSIFVIGCSPEYTLIVDNQSSKEVKFTMTIGYTTTKHTLTAGNTYIHPNSLPETLRKKEQIGDYDPKKFVYYIHCEDVYIFYDIPPEEP